MKRVSSLALACALVVLGGACTDCNGENPDGDAGPELSLTDADIQELCVIYAIGYANTFNSFLQPFTACSAEDTFISSDEALREELAEGCVPGNVDYDIFVTAREGGRVDIDMDLVRSCVDKGRAARPTSPIVEYNEGEGEIFALYDDADCQGSITGLVEEGGECVQQWDCTGDLVCQADPPDAATLRCLAPAADGDRCGGTRICDADLTCTDNETCAPSIAEGSDCVNDPLGGRECVVGTFCDQGDTNLCQPLFAAGSECTDEGQCEAGLGCTADPFTEPPTPGTCVPLAEPIADGQPCDPDADACAAPCSVCAPPSSAAAAVCLDRGAAGDYCEGQDQCRSGFSCDVGASACVANPVVNYPGLGESCTVDVGCDEGFCANGTCVEGEAGDPCDPDELECAGGFVCVVEATAGTCVALPEAGDACIEGSCVDSAFCNASDQCESLRGAGATCDVDNGGVECVSGTCLLSGTCAAPGPSCDESREFFIQYVTLGLLLPVFARLRRRRRRSAR